MKFRWLVIIVGFGIAVITPHIYLLVGSIAILMGYRGCKAMQWQGYQLFLACLYGGLVAGAMAKFAIFYGFTGQLVPLFLAPALTWLFCRALFLYFEENYSLLPIKRKKLRVKCESKTVEHNVAENNSSAQSTVKGISAWSGSGRGMSRLIQDDGTNIHWEFTNTGEIAMGGPTYGDVVFSNGCAFSGVGSSIAVSDDGQYAAMTLPSRSVWGLLVADLENKRVFESQENGLWEIDRIANGKILGRHSPLTSNANYQVTLRTVLDTFKELPMVLDDGWWVIDYEGRMAFPYYDTVTLDSSQKAHHVTFIPDLEPFKRNPFLRYSQPTYQVLVNGQALDMQVKNPGATWVDGANKNEEGRYLVLADNIIDCFDPLTKNFNLNAATLLKLPSWNASTHVTLSNFKSGGNALLLAEGTVCPRATSFNEAESLTQSFTHPWDEEEITYWDVTGKACQQQRTNIVRYVRYEIDLMQYGLRQVLPQSSIMHIVNRANSKHTITLLPAIVYNEATSYADYRCETSCGIDVGVVTEEAIWSRCGRYLAMVAYAEKPDVPRKIKIIDFVDGSAREIPGNYYLPSFIWFDETMLELTHVVALEEDATVYTPWRQIKNRIKVGDSKYQDNIYDLLIGSIEQRRAAMNKKAQKMQKKGSYSSGSVNLIAQHCILFAPDFAVPVLQPPTAKS